MAAVYERGGVWLPVPRPMPLRLVVRGALLNALAFTNGNQREAAGLLEVSQRQLCYALARYGIPGARGARRRKVVRRRRRLPRVVMFPRRRRRA